MAEAGAVAVAAGAAATGTSISAMAAAAAGALTTEALEAAAEVGEVAVGEASEAVVDAIAVGRAEEDAVGAGAAGETAACTAGRAATEGMVAVATGVGGDLAGMMSPSVNFGTAAATFAFLSSSAAASPLAWFAMFEMPFADSANVGAPCWRILSPIDSSLNRWPIALGGAPAAAVPAGAVVSICAGSACGCRVADSPALVVAVVSVVSACGGVT